ncbi:MAG: DUF2147 domain-containing protein [Xanthomonadaceae bacterium]|nr:DUF2147 domain-containing protein [Xanthomonadaceae bacterium]
MRFVPFALLVIASHAAAREPLPTGVWQTFDDDTHAPKALVEITEHADVLSGRIVKLFQAPGEKPNPLCTPCAGARHDQPVLGMTILWNFRHDGAAWDGGEVLDPESGDVYRATLHLRDGGKTLDVHGYVGIPLLGRSQIWTRVAD